MKKAFTIIELIISLIIFGTGILFILTILNNNILLSKKVSLKTEATILAKEGMEIIFNKRDSNNIKYKPWDYITGDTVNNRTQVKYFKTGTAYKVWTDFSGFQNNIEKISSPYTGNSKLFLKTGEILKQPSKVVVYSGFYYNYETGEKTPFSRYVMFTGVYLAPEVGVLSKDIMKVSSIVKYRFGVITGDIVLDSFISNWK